MGSLSALLEKKMPCVNDRTKNNAKPGKKDYKVELVM
jgi:hypothetical protein